MHWFRETLVLLNVLRSVVLGDLDVVDPVELLHVLALNEQLGSLGSLGSLNRAADTLSTLLAQEVKELNERQKAARRENTPDPGMMKGLKEATAVLKDLAGVVKTLNDQGTELEGTECGVVLLPPVEQEEKE